MLSIFKKICAEIKNQFGASICVLRSDNTKEFLSSSFVDFVLVGLSDPILGITEHKK